MFSHVRRMILTNITPRLFYKQRNFVNVSLKTLCTNADPDQPIDIPNPFEKEKKVCILCKFNIHADYKNVKLLSQFQSPYTGRIYGRHITGLCTNKQQEVEREIIKAQNAGLMGYLTKETTFLKDPKLFDPEQPIRAHRF